MSAAPKLDRSKLWGLEEYATRRDEFRRQVIEHKRARRVVLGAHAALHFEDFLTMKYQVQEMLRAERIFDPAEIAEEIAAYEPLIPDGANWKATFMIEYENVEDRRAALARLKDVEHRVWTQVGNEPRVFAIANEDLPRSNEEKTAAVHFLRFELTPAMVTAAKNGAPIAFGIDHPALGAGVTVSAETRASLTTDLA
jgi:hypothetical protein